MKSKGKTRGSADKASLEKRFETSTFCRSQIDSDLAVVTSVDQEGFEGKKKREGQNDLGASGQGEAQKKKKRFRRWSQKSRLPNRHLSARRRVMNLESHKARFTCLSLSRKKRPEKKNHRSRERSRRRG